MRKQEHIFIGKVLAIDELITKKLSEISEKLPTLAHESPASFACGYNAGYKAAMLDVDRIVHNDGEAAE
jgi:hypothetical protein